MRRTVLTGGARRARAVGHPAVCALESALRRGATRSRVAGFAHARAVFAVPSCRATAVALVGAERLTERRNEAGRIALADAVHASTLLRSSTVGRGVARGSRGSRSNRGEQQQDGDLEQRHDVRAARGPMTNQRPQQHITFFNLF